ncbi:NAD(P)-binding protein [Tricholoma matsutake]|nr:NAD(P)-binding protein [Tricholoma matsutake 945]
MATKRLFSEWVNRAIVYSENGDPSKVLTSLRYPSLPVPASNTVNIRFILTPINPADLNVIEGVYPSKPSVNTSLTPSGKGSKEHAVFVAGNEGLARVTAVGNGVNGLKEHDWVVMTKPQVGTWCTNKNVDVADVVRIPRVPNLSEAHGAMMTVNFPTAYNMLRDFVSLQPDDWIIQNGANSAVGQVVIQIAASRGVKTLNFVRNRDNIQELTGQLQTLGATKVLTYEALSDKSLRSMVKEWTDGKSIRLGLNCVGGKETSLMAKLLGNDAHLVSYGAMSRQPLSLPTSLFLFNNLTAHGFWQTRWNQYKSHVEKENIMQQLVELISEGKLKEPAHEIIHVSARDTDEEAGEKVREAIRKMSGGQYGKKVLLKLDTE